MKGILDELAGDGEQAVVCWDVRPRLSVTRHSELRVARMCHSLCKKQSTCHCEERQRRSTATSPATSTRGGNPQWPRWRLLRCARNDTARLCFLVASVAACPEFTLSLSKCVVEGSRGISACHARVARCGDSSTPFLIPNRGQVQRTFGLGKRQKRTWNYRRWLHLGIIASALHLN